MGSLLEQVVIVTEKEDPVAALARHFSDNTGLLEIGKQSPAILNSMDDSPRWE